MHMIRVDSDYGASWNAIIPQRDVLAQRTTEKCHGWVETERFLQTAFQQFHLVEIFHCGWSVRSAENRIHFLVHFVLYVGMQPEKE